MNRRRGRRSFLRWTACLLPGCLSLSLAWDTRPHQAITKAALDSLPQRILQRFAGELQPLVQIYCLLPDQYTEMEDFAFVRQGPGPRTAAEIRRYCVRPDGVRIHAATGDRDSDTASLLYLVRELRASLSARKTTEAARYAGVLSHFIADSLSPPHAVASEQLAAMLPESSAEAGAKMHAVIERSTPAFTLDARPPRQLSADTTKAGSAILERCYAGAARNRRDLPLILEAAGAGDEPTLNTYRLRAAAEAARILADALFTVCTPPAGSR